MLGLCWGRSAHWLALMKWVTLFALAAIIAYIVIALSGGRYADPDLKNIAILLAALSAVAGPVVVFRFTVSEQEMLSLSPRWPSAQMLNRGFLRLSLRHTVIVSLPLLFVLVVALGVMQATIDVAARSVLVWLTFTTSALASKLANKRSLADLSEMEKFHHPFLFVLAFSICFRYFPNALFWLIVFSCVVSCALLILKVRWFLSQSAVLPVRRSQGVLVDWSGVFGKGKA